MSNLLAQAEQLYEEAQRLICSAEDKLFHKPEITPADEIVWYETLAAAAELQEKAAHLLEQYRSTQ